MTILTVTEEGCSKLSLEAIKQLLNGESFEIQFIEYINFQTEQVTNIPVKLDPERRDEAKRLLIRMEFDASELAEHLADSFHCHFIDHSSKEDIHVAINKYFKKVRRRKAYQ